MNNLELWEFLLNELKKGEEAALVTVAASSDSSPGRQGFKMVVSRTGKTTGTIGGGVLEAKIIKDAINFLKEDTQSKLVTVFHDPNSSELKSGLICGGSQTIIFKKITRELFPFIEKVHSAVKSKERKLLRITSNSIQLLSEFKLNKKFAFTQKDFSEEFEYLEIIGRVETAYIIGGGHVGIEAAKILSFLGLYTIIIEERKNLFTLENVDADKIVYDKFSNCGKYIDENELSYVIIVTPKHISDKAALKSVINLDVKYIGMMGSVRKVKTIFELLETEGVERSKLKKVHSPIGLPINSETPREIAISIAAEIIKMKNSR